MKKIFITAFTLSLLVVNILIGQTSPADVSYNNKIELLEQKITKIKALPKEEQRPYFAVLSDVENRKNILKSLLKTPIEKRDITWENSWTQNFIKASDKLDKINIK